MNDSQEKLQCIIKDREQTGTMPARVSIFDEDNNYYAPSDALAYGYHTGSDWPADWGIKGIHKYFYTTGEFELNLPCKTVTVLIYHGLEYEAFKQQINLDVDTGLLEVELKRIINMVELGWYCGDNHSHYAHAPLDYKLTPQDGLFCAAAEGLDFICFLNNKLEQPLLIKSDRQQTVGQFAYEYGHHPVLNTEVRPPENLTCSLKSKGDWFTLNDWVHQQGGTIIMGHPLFANHLYSGLLADDVQPANMIHYELPINTMSGKVDSFELQNNRLSILETWLQIWYRLLNCGINIPASAGTDACLSVKTTLPVGIYRSYVQAADGSFDAYLNGLKNGCSFITDGPLLFLTINGKAPGTQIKLSDSNNSLQVKIVVKSIFSLPGVELVKNGKVISAWELNGEKEFKVACDIQIDDSCWLALRVLRLRKNHKEHTETELFAHTNPVFIDYNAQPISSSEDALFFLQWIEIVKKYRMQTLNNKTVALAVSMASEKYQAQLTTADAAGWKLLKQKIKNQKLTDFTVENSSIVTAAVKLQKEENSLNDIECMSDSIELEGECFYKLSAKCRRPSGVSADKSAGYTYGKIVVFDDVGTYLGVAEDKSAGGSWAEISTLIYLPANAQKIVITYCLETSGSIEFRQVAIHKLQGGDLFKMIK